MSQAQPAIVYEIKLQYPPRGDSHAAEEDPIDLNSRWPTIQSQLEQIPTDAKSLLINHDVPTDEEWSVLGAYFTSIERLEIEAGFDEGLSDRLIPSHWPLERLTLVSSIGDVIQTPHILLGKVKHLILLFTAGLRFEGPTSAELTKAHEEAVQKGEKQDHYVGDGGIKLTSLPTLASEWMQDKYSDPSFQGSSQKSAVNADLKINSSDIVETNNQEPGTFNLAIFEIIENDAIETFMRFTIALPHLSHNLRSLKIHSTNRCDLNELSESMFGPLLHSLNRLEILELTLGEVFDDEDTDSNTLGTLYKHLPPNIQELRFRGPVSLINNSRWNDWVTAFENPAFLAKLEILRFVCDLAYGLVPAKYPYVKIRSATVDELTAARIQCKRLTDALSNREGDKAVQIEPFVEK